MCIIREFRFEIRTTVQRRKRTLDLETGSREINFYRIRKHG